MRGPCIIQQYRDHSSTFYKVYVIDKDVLVYRRPSLPDLERLRNIGVQTLPSPVPSSEGDNVVAGNETDRHTDSTTVRATEGVKSIVFDSRYAYPTIEDFLVPCEAPIHVDGIPTDVTHSPFNLTGKVVVEGNICIFVSIYLSIYLSIHIYICLYLYICMDLYVCILY